MTERHPIETNRTIDERVTIKWAMRILKHGESVIAMDRRLRRSPALIETVEKVLKLARQCLAHSRLARLPMKKCAEVLWGIRTQFVEKSIPKTSTSSHSTNSLGRNAKRDWEDLYTVYYSKNYKIAST
ncbi:hypothetical protein EJD97_019513 [Solanum chilense]|uniref:Serine-threonine/tyrosine-protein kinase catalytic domain-containing protein n=1 Tax=Solanum chilense TaxID=4083 RepID=A0A6N2B390_SOLCI|nr:hypothetical protein EJD97_019513 [Solanum chilense]